MYDNIFDFKCVLLYRFSYRLSIEYRLNRNGLISYYQNDYFIVIMFIVRTRVKIIDIFFFFLLTLGRFVYVLFARRFKQNVNLQKKKI